MFHTAKTEVVAEAERQHWFRQQPMHARRAHRKDAKTQSRVVTVVLMVASTRAKLGHVRNQNVWFHPCQSRILDGDVLETSNALLPCGACFGRHTLSPCIVRNGVKIETKNVVVPRDTVLKVSSRPWCPSYSEWPTGIQGSQGTLLDSDKPGQNQLGCCFLWTKFRQFHFYCYGGGVWITNQ